MEFEFDSNKSIANKKKHGIDFQEAQRLWDDPDYLQIPAITADEPRFLPRFLIIGKIDKRHWSAVVTYRNGKIRIISVRRSRKEEEALYEG